MFGGFSHAQHVVAKHDINGALGSLGYPKVNRGTRGIVRSGPTGLFSSQYEVEFMNGVVAHVHARDLRPAAFGHGESAWEMRKTLRTAVAWIIFITLIPTILGVIRYYAHGGHTSGLIAGLPDAAVQSITSLFSQAVGLVGLPVVVILLLLIWLARRR